MGGHIFPLSEVTERKLGNEIETNQYDYMGHFWGYFAQFMTKAADECAAQWNEILLKKNPPVVNDEQLKDYACIGRAIVYSTDYSEADTFGQCVTRFMEQVYI